MKSSFDLDLNIEETPEKRGGFTINTLSKLCTITAIGCYPTGPMSECLGTSNCNTKTDCMA